jgi:hypothetical protein
MLLDFHLARGPLARGERHAWLGGTPGSMSPEQEAALAALRDGRPIPAPVDHRSDIYSLGVLLDEMRRQSRQTAPKLEKIVGRCLARSPEDRPRNAAELALELRRALAERPVDLVSAAPDTGRRRRPAALLTLAMLFLACAWGSVETIRLRRAHEVLAEQENLIRAFAHRERALKLAANLHAVTDRLRWLAAESRRPGDLEATCRPLWERRRQFLDAAQSLDSRQQAQVREDLLEAAILWAESQHPDDAALKSRVAILVAEAAADLDGGSFLAFVAEPARGRAPAEFSRAAKTAWEHYVVGRTLLRAGRLSDAHVTLRRGVVRYPDHLWLQFTLGQCAARLSQDNEALDAYSACIALAPSRPEPRLRRAELHRELGQHDLANLDERVAERLTAADRDRADANR